MCWQQQSRPAKPAPLLFPCELVNLSQYHKIWASHSKFVYPLSYRVSATNSISKLLLVILSPSDPALLPHYSAGCAVESELDAIIIEGGFDTTGAIWHTVTNQCFSNLLSLMTLEGVTEKIMPSEKLTQILLKATTTFDQSQDTISLSLLIKLTGRLLLHWNVLPIPWYLSFMHFGFYIPWAL